MKYLLIFHAELPTHVAEVVREVEVSSSDELRGAIEIIGDEISDARGYFFSCIGVEEPDESEYED